MIYLRSSEIHDGAPFAAWVRAWATIMLFDASQISQHYIKKQTNRFWGIKHWPPVQCSRTAWLSLTALNREQWARCVRL
ncbi:hypothetical protein A0H81_01863 [Grifola frondosa]|uniref:Uncharacterized protein n=1 Tax=Grifola frondosa TaxID=5627 RepID=A0A1C7MM78_GRIFR|nr:hypothetical protein A0H81_01863 [Grifola frondosa]